MPSPPWWPAIHCTSDSSNLGCIHINSYWKHWPCVFPQHGPGPKHQRSIQLHDWQQRIVSGYPHLLLRGLIHSDGCRTTNTVTRRLAAGAKQYSYPRYMFTNESQDIMRIFCDACDRVGVTWRRMNRKTISIARRDDVDRLDLFIGPKY